MCFFFSLLAWGQKESFSYEELKNGFITQYIKKNSTKSLDSLDILYWTSINDFQTINSTSSYYIIPNSPLHRAGDLLLPVSKFVYLSEFIDTLANEVHQLYWIEPRHNFLSKEDIKLKNKMRKKYGYVILNDTTTLIPAKWFSGELNFLESPYLYGNEYVSNRLCTVLLTHGKFCPQRIETPAFSSQWKIGGELDFTISQIENMQENGRRMNNPISPQLKREKALLLFSKQISQYFDFSFLPADYQSKKYTIMLRLDETLKAHLYVLQPEELHIEDRLVLTALSMAVEQQPAGIFSGYWCARGLYPAIFLHARISKRFGCKFYYYDAN